MFKMKKVEIYKVEYTITTQPDTNWNAYVAGFNSQSVIEYVEGFVEGRVQINSMTTVSRLDAVTNEVREFIAAPLLPFGEEETVSEDTEQPDVQDEQDESQPVKKKSIVPKG